MFRNLLVKRLFARAFGRRLDLSACQITSSYLRTLLHHRRSEFEGLADLSLAKNLLSDPECILRLMDALSSTLSRIDVRGNPLRWSEQTAVPLSILEDQNPETLYQSLSRGIDPANNRVVTSELAEHVQADKSPDRLTTTLTPVPQTEAAPRSPNSIVLEDLDVAILHAIDNETTDKNKPFSATDLHGCLQVDYHERWSKIDAKTVKSATERLNPLLISFDKRGKVKHHFLTEDGKLLLAKNRHRVRSSR